MARRLSQNLECPHCRTSLHSILERQSRCEPPFPRRPRPQARQGAAI